MDNNELIKAKGGVGVPVGTKKTFGGREYIKTADGWKYLGKGGGKKAKQHAAAHSAPKGEGEKTHSSSATDTSKLEEHAKEASSEKLTAVAHDESYSKEMREVAEKELESRKEGEAKHDKEDTTDAVDKKEKEASVKDSDSSAKKDLPSTDGDLPGKESAADAETLREKDGPAKLSEKKEGFSVKSPEALTSSDSEDDEEDDINHKFAAFGRFAAGVIKGRMKSLIAYGSGGVGKTYTVTQELQKAGKKIYDPELHDPGDDGYDYVKLTGKMTAAAVYQAMYEHNGKILLFDDCDSVLQDENAINLFKGALDTSGDGSIDWGSAKKLKDSSGQPIPGKFSFNGRAMFISNLDIGGKAGEDIQPIISRGYGINLAMDPEQTMKRIKHIATGKNGEYTNLKFPGIPKYSHEDMEAVFDYMDKHRDKAADLNVRTVATLLAIKLDAEEANEKDWTRDAKYVYLRKSEEPDIYNGGLFMKRQDIINKSLGVDTKSIEDKKIEWCTLRKSLYKNNVFSLEPR